MAIPYAQIIQAERKAEAAFIHEVRVQRAVLDMSQRELGEEIGVSSSVMSDLLKSPGKICVGRLRGIIRALGLDPFVVLALLGYSEKEIQRLKKNIREGSA